MVIKGSERRLFARRLFRTKVVFEDEFGEGLFYLYSEDISMGGVFIIGDIPIAASSYVFLSFFLPETKVKIHATGQVMRVTRDAEGKEGIGIRFVGLSSEAAEAITEFVS